MDMLSQRYACPFLVLDEFIRLQQLHDFLYEILKTIAEEKTHKSRWEFYLHKVYDMTFDEYVQLCENPPQQEQDMTHEQIGNVINESKMMLDGFVPQ